MKKPSPTLNRYQLLSTSWPAAGSAAAPKVRRYRLARIEQGGRNPGGERFEHLRRAYD